MEHAAPLISDEGALRGLDRILPVLRHIDAHKADPIGRGELGALVGLSPVRLHALFKAVMGLAPMAYVKRVRLREAQVRLVTSGLSAAEIGQAVGYGDPFRFSRLFKAAFGLSPLRYRQQIGRMG